jgi:hypothetical protein
MSADYIQSRLDPTIKTVSVDFGGGNIYTYKTRLDFEPQDYGLVRVDHEIAVVEIKEIHDNPVTEPSATLHQWVFQKVDQSLINSLERGDKIFREAIKRKDADGNPKFNNEQLKSTFMTYNKSFKKKEKFVVDDEPTML